MSVFFTFNLLQNIANNFPIDISILEIWKEVQIDPPPRKNLEAIPKGDQHLLKDNINNIRLMNCLNWDWNQTTTTMPSFWCLFIILFLSIFSILILCFYCWLWASEQNPEVHLGHCRTPMVSFFCGNSWQLKTINTLQPGSEGHRYVNKPAAKNCKFI